MTGLMNRGHDFEILACGVPLQEEIHEDVNRYDLLQKTQYVLFKNDITLLNVVNAKKLVASLRTDLIHAHIAAIPPDIAYGIFTRTEIPFIITAHADNTSINPDVFRLMAKFLAPIRGITGSQLFYLALSGIEFESKISVNLYGINFLRLRYQERNENDRIKILYVERLVEKKESLDGKTPFNKCKKKMPLTEPKVIGNGPRFEQAKDRVEENNLTERVQFPGGLTKEKVITEMKNATILLHAAQKAFHGDPEGLPVGIL